MPGFTPAYALYLEKRADKTLSRLPAEVRERLEDALDSLADDPRPAGAVKLSGREGYRLRVGDYRVLYRVDDERREVLVTRVGHRREVYR